MGGPLTYEEILLATQKAKSKSGWNHQIKNFVETGTYKGDTCCMASPNYENVYTVEIHEPLYTESKNRAMSEQLSNIHFYLGDSTEQLENIAPQVRDGAVFFIDAHISGHDSSWNHRERVPLMREIQTILKYVTGPSVFIVDDARLWTNEVWDWAHVTNKAIVDLFDSSKVLTSFLKNDRFYVFTE
jgi:hypothetical protein